jgi:hypothetical protein
MIRRALVILFALGFATQADAQGFAPGQQLRVEGGGRFQPADFGPNDPESERDKAIEARDRFAEARRLSENERASKQSELDALDAAVNGVKENVAKTQQGALDSARNLPKRIGQAASGKPRSQAKAAWGAYNDLAKTKGAYDEAGYGMEVGVGPERGRLRSQINKLTKDVEFYEDQEAYWQAKADEASAEIEADAAFVRGLERSRNQAAWKAWADEQMALARAARARDNAAASARAKAQAEAQAAAQSARTRDSDPSRTGGERAAEGKDRDRDRPRGEVSVPRGAESRMHGDHQDVTFK